MLIIPAIDLKNKKVVRLRQGNYQSVTVYSDDPVAVARDWEKRGAKLLHVVDLDGAAEGKLKNLEVAADIAASVSIPVQLGGGIRDRKTIEEVLAQGIARVILGTKAVEDKDFVQKMTAVFGGRVLVSLDARDEQVATCGWQEETDEDISSLLQRFEEAKVKTIIYTDITRDGELAGPNFEGIKKILSATRIPLIASGGVTSCEDIKRLKGLEKEGLAGVIVGKALYEKKIALEEALKA